MKSRNLLSLGLGIAIVSVLCKPTVAESERHPGNLPNYPSPEQIKATIAEARRRNRECQTPSRPSLCPRNPDAPAPKDGGAFRAAWMKADPQVAKFLGRWYEDLEYQIAVYPSTVKGQVCIITTSDASAFGVGKVNGNTLRYVNKSTYGIDGYINPQEKPIELHFIGKPNILMTRENSVSRPWMLAFATSFAAQPIDGSLQRFQQLFDRAGCTTGLPEGAIAQPTKPVVPQGVNGTWSGSWDGHNGYLYDFTMKLTTDASNRVSGNITWTLKASPYSVHQSKIGSTAVEYVDGVYDPQASYLEMVGKRKDDPNNILALDVYRISFSSNMQRLTGKTRNNGSWTGEISGQSTVP